MKICTLLASIAIAALAVGACDGRTIQPTITFSSARVVSATFNDDLRLEPKLVEGDASKGAVELLQVTFTSSTSLVSYAKQTEYNIAVEARTCGEPSRLLSGGSVYSAGVVVSPYSRGSDAPAGEPKAYKVYFPVRSSDPSNEYDLLASPVELCLLVLGGDMSGSSFRSNVIAVPIVVGQ